jgi:hypothetical protein
MEGLGPAVEEARLVLAQRYAVLVDTTSWTHEAGAISVTGGVLVTAQAKSYSEIIGAALELEAPRPAVLSDLDTDWATLEWRSLPVGTLLDLHRTHEGGDRQTQWVGPAALRWYTVRGRYALVQLPDGTLGWAEHSLLTPCQPDSDPWAHILRPVFGRSVSVDATIDSVLEPARRRLGNPYLWGGNTIAAADCSGLVQDLVFSACNLLLPKHTGDQRKMGARVAAADIAPGDLVFVRGTDQGIAHIGLALPGVSGGSVVVVHSCLTKNKVMEEPLEVFLGRYRFTAARRPVAWGSTP